MSWEGVSLGGRQTAKEGRQGTDDGFASIPRRPSLIPWWSLALSHAAVGMYLTARLGFYPALSAAFHLNYQQLGLITTITTLVASLGQPAFGALGDRLGPRLLLPWGLALLGLGTGLIGLMPGYPAVVGLAGVSVLGVAAFWPVGAAVVTAIAPPAQRGTAFAIFQASGSLGAVIGPLVANDVLAVAGLRGTVLLIPIGLAAALLLWSTLCPAVIHAEGLPDGLPVRRSLLTGLGLPLLIMVAAALVLTCYNSYLTVLETGRGVPQEVANRELSLLFVAGVLGPFLAGPLSDRLGRSPVIAACLAGSVGTHLAFLFAPLPWRLLALALTGMLLPGAAILAVLLAQEMRPEARATAAGVVQGLGYTGAALGTWLVGALADAWGPVSALSTLAPVAASGALMALALRSFPLPRSSGRGG